LVKQSCRVAREFLNVCQAERLEVIAALGGLEVRIVEQSAFGEFPIEARLDPMSLNRV
jgi:hypothetical protein